MSNYNLVVKNCELSLGATKEEVYDCLFKLVDEDYNGENHMYMHSFTHGVYSTLEMKIDDFDECKSIVKFIEDILNECYSKKKYKDYKITTNVLYDTIFVVVSAMEEVK